MDCNNCVFEGRLTKDPVYAKTSSGKSKLTFCLAVNSAKNITDFLDFEAWEGKADSLNTLLTKGKMVCVVSQARYSKWQDNKTGETKSRINFIVRDCYLHGSSSGSENPADEYVTKAAAEAKKEEPLPTCHFTEDIPFGVNPDDVPGPEKFKDDIPF